VARINREAARILGSAEVKARLVPQGMDLTTSSPEELAALIRQEYASWGKVIREAGIKGE
jgi:tripartite-type tricarboxylate transporter receptor subunit TctC